MTIAGLLGRKIGMTTYYHEDGTAESVTAVEVGPCVVTQVKTEARDGYEAVQLGFGSARRLNSPEAGHQDRSGRRFTHLQEFGVDDLTAVADRLGQLGSNHGCCRGRCWGWIRTATAWRW